MSCKASVSRSVKQKWSVAQCAECGSCPLVIWLATKPSGGGSVTTFRVLWADSSWAVASTWFLIESNDRNLLSLMACRCTLWCWFPVPAHPDGALLDWVLVTAEATGGQWTHYHVLESSVMIWALWHGGDPAGSSHQCMYVVHLNHR